MSGDIRAGSKASEMRGDSYHKIKADMTNMKDRAKKCKLNITDET